MIDIQVLASSSKGNCYKVTDGTTPLLLECGINYRDIQIGLDFKMSQIAGCVISHHHKDHMKSIKDIMKAGIDCYMSVETAAGLTGHRIKTIEPLKQFHIGTWTILPFDTQHDIEGALGFLLENEYGERLLFATDTYYIEYQFKHLTHIMIECNYGEDILNENVEKGIIPEVMKRRLLQSHFSLENVKEFLKANDLFKVQEIYLIHLSDNNSDAGRFKREIQALTGKQTIIAGG